MKVVKSIALISGSNKNDGMQISSRHYEKELSKYYKTQWYQCIDPGHSDTYGIGKPIKGIRIPIGKIEIGVNRLFVFPRRFQDQFHDLFILTDPTLINIPKFPDKTLVKIHDLRPITEFADSILATMMYKSILPKLSNVGGIIVTTEWTKKQLEDTFDDLNDIFVIPESHGYSNLKPEHIQKSAERIEDGVVNITYIGTDRSYKNLPFFIELAESLNKASEINFRYHLVSKLKKETKERIISKRIRGLQLHENMDSIEQIYDETDIYVHPSLYEGFGRPIVEAMAFGIPVISNDIDPIHEITGKNGLFAPVTDVEMWVGKILALLNVENYKLNAKMSIDRAKYYSLEALGTRLNNAVGHFLEK